MTPFPREAYRPLEPYAPDRRPIRVDLSDNTNRWGVHPDALAAVRDADPEELLRYPPVYADRLRAAVARRFGVPPETVGTGCGSDDLLDSIFRASGEPGEGVAYLPPTFSMIEIFSRMNALEARPLDRFGGRAGMGSGRVGGSDDSAEAAWKGSPLLGRLPDPGELMEGNPTLIYLCRPNNPTGEVVPREWLLQVMEAVEPRGPILLIDEAYADFLDPAEEDPNGLLLRAADSRRTVVLRTLSKAYGLAGLRVGFAVGAPEVIRELEKSRGPYKVNRLAEAAGVAALRDEVGWIPGILEATRSARTDLEVELRRRGLPPLPSGANFLCLPLTGAETEARFQVEPTAAAVTAALRDREVAVRPFPSLPGVGEAIRVSLGPPDEMNTFLDALDEILT